jgi:hypothetical protein
MTTDGYPLAYEVAILAAYATITPPQRQAGRPKAPTLSRLRA